MLLVVDPISVFRPEEFRQLPEPLARPEFLRAVRWARPALHSPEWLWEAWRSHSIGQIEAATVERALAEHFEQDPEYSRLALLGFMYQHHANGESETRTHIVPVSDEDAEMDALETFWRVAKWATDRHCTFVTWGGRSWGLPFVVRRTILRGRMPSTTLPVGRARLDAHFDCADVLSNWDSARRRSLELSARQYGLEGPWNDANSPDLPTGPAIREAVGAGALERATRLSTVRMRAILGLYQRLNEPYMAAVG